MRSLHVGIKKSIIHKVTLKKFLILYKKWNISGSWKKVLWFKQGSENEQFSFQQCQGLKASAVVHLYQTSLEWPPHPPLPGYLLDIDQKYHSLVKSN